MLVHRLDMDTSGLMVLARTRDAHLALHRQFSERRVNKRYIAELERSPPARHGQVRLPLRLDPDNRPIQKVCFRYGKLACTRWHALGGRLIELWPITGRSHQLRVHLASPLGLDIPIRGDRLYGQADDAGGGLRLHAAELAFEHPQHGRRCRFSAPAPFAS